MEVKSAVSIFDKELGCFCLKLATADEVDKTFDISQSLRGNPIGDGRSMSSFRLIPMSAL